MSPNDGTKIRVLVVDDEPIARRGLRFLLSERPDMELVGEATTGREAIAMIGELRPDLVLLDLQMPGAGGFDVIRSIDGAEMPEIVCVTAYDEFARHAFDAAAVDYVVKPYTAERLHTALSRAARRLTDRRTSAVLERVRSLLETPNDPPRGSEPASTTYVARLLVSIGSKSVVVPVPSVLALKADGTYVRILTRSGQFTLRESLNDLEARLDPREFVRVHRSTIVRIDAVRSLERPQPERLVLALDNDVRIPVSRSRRDEVVRALGSIQG